MSLIFIYLLIFVGSFDFYFLFFIINLHKSLGIFRHNFSPIPKLKNTKKRRKTKMADGYSKIKAACKLKSRSIDYSDLSSLPHSLRFNAAVSNPISHDSSQNRRNRPREPPHGRLPEEVEEEEEEEKEYEYGGTGTGTVATLSRNSSVSSSASGFQSAVKRALSMRRSSSVAERYCRIHDQFATFATAMEDDEMEGGKAGGSVMKEKKKKTAAGKMVRACKRLLGL
ncbi:unnamed protein product [Citrullus colocynthis]|uniref:Uncharacterized protein n=1 Tax=Citrullus colocynthis TaxID=252529 RepID=A0ABP0YNJ4_9ROSI